MGTYITTLPETFVEEMLFLAEAVDYVNQQFPQRGRTYESDWEAVKDWRDREGEEAVKQRIRLWRRRSN